MKILLVGEYSRLHNSLKEGLIKLNHEVVIISTGDGFKNYDSDFKIKNYFHKGFLAKFKVLLYKVTSFNIESLFTYWQCKKIAKSFDYFDVVQYINETPFNISLNFEKKIIKLFNSKSKKNFFLACGTDYVSVKYAYDKKFRYSILTPYFYNNKNQKNYIHILNKLSPSHINLHNYIVKITNGFISSDFDYHIPYYKTPKYLGMIPNPINCDKIAYIYPYVDNKLTIFHGINTTNYTKKGNRFFEEALEIILKKYRDKIEVIQTKDVPYKEYINNYNNAHILLDQVYAYDQGYNALEAMAKGKVVFTGAEQEWLEYYQIEDNTVAINALPNTQQIVEKLELLIENPKKVQLISKNARDFIEKNHHYIKIATQYVDTWNAN